MIFATDSLALDAALARVGRIEVAKPFPNEHAARVEDPGDFQPDSFRRIPIGDGVDGIIGRPKGETKTRIQSYRFDADAFTAAEARAWLRDNDVGGASFEAAVGADAVGAAKRQAEQQSEQQAERQAELFAPPGARRVRVLKQDDAELTVTYVVMEAGRPDTDDAFTRLKAIRAAAIGFMRAPMVTAGHGTPSKPGPVIAGWVALNWITAEDLDELEGQALDPPLAAGSWVQTFRFADRATWEAAREEGFTGASIEGWPEEGAGARVARGRAPPLAAAGPAT